MLNEKREGMVPKTLKGKSWNSLNNFQTRVNLCLLWEYKNIREKDDLKNFPKIVSEPEGLKFISRFGVQIRSRNNRFAADRNDAGLEIATDPAKCIPPLGK
jgi:hypothetical protein